MNKSESGSHSQESFIKKWWWLIVLISIISFKGYIYFLWSNIVDQEKEMKSIVQEFSQASLQTWNQISYDSIINRLDTFNPSTESLKNQKWTMLKFLRITKETYLMWQELRKEGETELNDKKSIVAHLEKSELYKTKTEELIKLLNTFPWTDKITQKTENAEKMYTSVLKYVDADIEFYKYKLSILDHISINKDWDMEIDNDSMLNKYNELVDKRDFTIDSANKMKEIQGIK